MSMNEPLSNADTEREWLSRCRDDVERAEAHLLAAQVPEAWVATGPDGADLDLARAASAYSLEAEAVDDLLAPLDAEVRGRIADDVLRSYLAGRGDEAPQTVAPAPAAVIAANDAGPRRRWWPLPMTAVAAALLTLFYVDLRGRAGMSAELFEGSVLLAPTVRAGPGQGPPAPEMSVRGEDYFRLVCRAEGRTVKIVSVRAELAGESRFLGFKEVDDGAALRAHADLGPGRWAVTCLAQETSSGHLRPLGPPATLVVVE